MKQHQRELAILIMAAGKGTRMKSELAKVLHPLRGRAMIHSVLEIAQRLSAERIVVIVGHQKERVIAELRDLQVRFTVQEPQLGTGHAVLCALPQLAGFAGSVLILSGDVPLIKVATLQQLLERHWQSQAAATVVTATAENPKGYGRILRGADGNLTAIIEERDANDEIRRIREINSGIYVFEAEELRRLLPALRADNDQKEYYLTDAVRLLTSEGKTVAAFTGVFNEVMGVNTVIELVQAEATLAQER